MMQGTIYIKGTHCTEDGTRTRTGITAHWILIPARLPISPLRRVSELTSHRGISPVGFYLLFRGVCSLHTPFPTVVGVRLVFQ